ncbi:MAG: lytic transglycosylase domain-containing protein [Spirochaetes bacterium]|nr:MAG: lytic transglycosylase domain-containing protein [Spirochaetota bacterium]
MDDIDTELSADHGGPGGSATRLGSPMGGGMPPGGAPMAAAPMPPQMPPMQMPQAPAPTGNYTMPASMMSKLMDNFDPSKASSAGKDSLMAANGIKEGKIPPGSVTMQKTGLGPLSKSQMHATIEKALDLNGISKDPKVRSQWHSVLEFMAKKESSYNPDAVNLHDTNARGARAMDGHPGQCSRGIWQTIPTTFAANHVSGTSSNIYDPVASGAAAVRYIMGRYDVDPAGGASLQKFYANRMAGGYTGY